MPLRSGFIYILRSVPTFLELRLYKVKPQDKRFRFSFKRVTIYSVMRSCCSLRRTSQEHISAGCQMLEQWVQLKARRIILDYLI